MSADRDTRHRLEEVQQRLSGIDAEVALEESNGFADEMRHLEAQLDLARGRAQRTEARLEEVQRELGAAEQTVRELELAAQAKQSNHIDDVLGAVTGTVMVGIIGVVAWFVPKETQLPLEVVASVGMCCSAALGAVLRARVLRPKRGPRS